MENKLELGEVGGCREFSEHMGDISKKIPRKFREISGKRTGFTENYWKFSTTENYWNFQILRTEIITEIEINNLVNIRSIK